MLRKPQTKQLSSQDQVGRRSGFETRPYNGVIFHAECKLISCICYILNLDS